MTTFLAVLGALLWGAAVVACFAIASSDLADTIGKMIGWALLGVSLLAIGITLMAKAGWLTDEIPESGCWRITTDTNVAVVGRSVIVTDDRSFEEVPCP